MVEKLVEPLRRRRPSVSPSPLGTHFLYYQRRPLPRLRHGRRQGDERDREGRRPSFVDTEDDHNFDKPATPPIGWSRDGKSVLLSDGWDIWQVATDGTGGDEPDVNGKKDGIRYRGLIAVRARTEAGHRPDPAGLHADVRRVDEEGRASAASTRASRGRTSCCGTTAPTARRMKARNADVFAFTRQTAVDYPTTT